MYEVLCKYLFLTNIVIDTGDQNNTKCNVWGIIEVTWLRHISLLSIMIRIPKIACMRYCVYTSNFSNNVMCCASIITCAIKYVIFYHIFKISRYFRKRWSVNTLQYSVIIPCAIICCLCSSPIIVSMVWFVNWRITDWT